jgi:hypothetical protein
MSDDLLAVTTSATPEVLPGVHSVRMHSDITELVADRFPGALLRDGWKNTLTNIPEHQLGWSRAELDSLYILSPIHVPRSDDLVRRTRVEPVEAAFLLATFTKINDLLGHLEAGKMLVWIAEIVSRIPVYRLEVSRDLERLPRVSAQIFAWHSGATR